MRRLSVRGAICIAVGSLMYAMVGKRPDIAQAMRVVSSMSNLEKKH